MKTYFKEAGSVDFEALETASFLTLSPYGEVMTRDGQQQFEAVTPFEVETWSLFAGFADRPGKCCADFESRDDAIKALVAVSNGRPCWYSDSGGQFEVVDFGALGERI